MEGSDTFNGESGEEKDTIEMKNFTMLEQWDMQSFKFPERCFLGAYISVINEAIITETAPRTTSIKVCKEGFNLLFKVLSINILYLFNCKNIIIFETIFRVIDNGIRNNNKEAYNDSTHTRGAVRF